MTCPHKRNTNKHSSLKRNTIINNFIILSSCSYQLLDTQQMADKSPIKFSLAKEDFKQEETPVASPVGDVKKQTEQSKSEHSYFSTNS